MCKLFGAESKHTNHGNIIVFKDVEKLKEIRDNYNTELPVIRCSLKGEGSEGSEGSIEPTPQICEINLKDTNEPLPTNT